MLAAKERAHLVLVEQIPRGRVQHAADVFAPLPAKPVMQWKREALFSLQVERLRQYALRQHLQQDFAISVGSAQVIGHCSKSKFDDPIIEKWRTYLERGQHARSVNFYQNVFRQVGV